MGALVVPTACPENVRLVGAKVTGTAPVPDTAAICGLPGPLVAIATDPLTAPVSEGVKVTDKVQLADFARAPPHGELPLPTAVKFALAPMLLMVTVPVPLFVTVIVLAALVAPTPVDEKVNEVGLNFNGTVGPPVAAPLNPTVSVLKALLVVTSSAPLMVPLYWGVNVTTMVQVAPPARELPQLPPVTEKSALAVELRVIAVVCMLVRVTVADDVEPTAALGNVRLVGLTVIGASPVPVSLTSCGLVPALSLKVNAPVIAPTPLGLNVTFTVQLLFAASELLQLFVSLKSPLATIEPMESGPEPEFVSFTALEALVVPAATFAKARVFSLTDAVPPVAIKT